MDDGKNSKIQSAMRDSTTSSFRKYRELCYGKTSLGYFLKANWLFSTFGSMPGPAGLLLRGRLYRGLFAGVGHKLVIGRNVTFRHPHKIRFGNNVIIDDDCMIDAKGQNNEGIVIGDNVYIGRQSIIYCKNGNITLESDVNISSRCTLFSSNAMTIGKGCVIGAYSYLLSGGEYDYADPTPFAEQNGMKTRGVLSIGPDCWIGTRVTVLDAANIGTRCVIGANALVNKPIPDNSLALGSPAKVVKSMGFVSQHGSNLEP